MAQTDFGQTVLNPNFPNINFPNNQGDSIGRISAHLID
jgi:hypothetical protein